MVDFNHDYLKKHLDHEYTVEVEHFKVDMGGLNTNLNEVNLTAQVIYDSLLKTEKGFLCINDNKYYSPFLIMVCYITDSPFIYYVCKKEEPFIIIQLTVYATFHWYYEVKTGQFLRNEARSGEEHYNGGLQDQLKKVLKQLNTKSPSPLNSITIKNKYFYFGFNMNIGHHLWNEVSGLLYLINNEDLLKNISKIMIGPYDFFNIENILKNKNITTEKWNGQRQQWAPLQNVDHIPIKPHGMYIPNDVTKLFNIPVNEKNKNEIILTIDIRGYRRALDNQGKWYSYLINKVHKTFPDKKIKLNICGHFISFHNDAKPNMTEIKQQQDIVAKIIYNLYRDIDIQINNLIGSNILNCFEESSNSDLCLATLGTSISNLSNWIFKNKIIVYGPTACYTWNSIQNDIMNNKEGIFLPIEFIISEPNNQQCNYNLKYEEASDFIIKELQSIISDK